MKLHLDMDVPGPGYKISHNDKLLLLGSCFSTNIGELLTDHGFDVHCNPGGIFFNPASLGDWLRTMITRGKPDEKSFTTRNNTWLSFDHHSAFKANDKDELFRMLEYEITQAHQFLTKADFLFITFGTAWAYIHSDLNKVVANCHKRPQADFTKVLLSTDDIVHTYEQIFLHLRTLNKKVKVVLTVSPVKHLRDGVIENNLSKAVLLLSVNELVRRIKDVFYFPAFELVNDDLRDHRFYKSDLAHPNDQAITYVWEKFSGCFFDERTRRINQEIARLNTYLKHRAGERDDSTFVAEQKKRIRELHPGFKA